MLELDQDHQVAAWQVTDSQALRVQQFALAAEELLPLQRRAVVSGQPAGRRLSLSVSYDHPRPDELEVTLLVEKFPYCRLMNPLCQQQMKPALPIQDLFWRCSRWQLCQP